MRVVRSLLLPMVGVSIAASSSAEVEVAPQGFVVTQVTTIDAPPARVYATLVDAIGAWWSPAHTWSGDSRNLSIDARPGGCFCERLPDGGGVEHLRVVYVAPGRLLRLTGGLGPLQASGLAGALTWTFASAGKGTRLELAYRVGGHLPGGFATLGPAVDAVLAEQTERLKRFVETGTPVVQ